MLNHEFRGNERLIKGCRGRIVAEKVMNSFVTLKTLKEEEAVFMIQMKEQERKLREVTQNLTKDISSPRHSLVQPT
jgi:hypothetical protein